MADGNTESHEAQLCAGVESVTGTNNIPLGSRTIKQEQDQIADAEDTIFLGVDIPLSTQPEMPNPQDSRLPMPSASDNRHQTSEVSRWINPLGSTFGQSRMWIGNSCSVHADFTSVPWVMARAISPTFTSSR